MAALKRQGDPEDSWSDGWKRMIPIGIIPLIVMSITYVILADLPQSRVSNLDWAIQTQYAYDPLRSSSGLWKAP